MTSRWPVTALWYVSFVAIAIPVQLLRQRGVPSWDSVWAEDGAVFLTDAVALPISSTLLRSYAGYAHGLPRVLAELVVLLPIRWWAAAAAVAAASTAALAGLFAFTASRPWCPSWPRRAVLAGMFLVLPAALFETAANLANIQWYLLAALPLAFIAPFDPPFRAVAAGFVAVVALTAPLAAVFLPFVILGMIRHRDFAHLVPGGTFLAAVAVQLGASLATQSDSIGSGGGILPISFYPTRVVGRLLLGEVTFGHAWKAAAAGVVAVSIAAMAALFGRTRGDACRLRTTLVLFGASVLIFMTPVALRGSGMSHTNASEQRYAIAPMLLLTAAALVPPADSRRRRRSDQLLLIGMALWLIVAVAPSFRASNPRSEAPGWSASLQAAADECEHLGSDAVSVGVAPAPSTRVWAVELPCAALAGDL